MDQMTLAAAADASAGFVRFRKPTRRDAFLAEMQTLVPWARLVALIEPHYPKPGNGRPPVGLERILRGHLLQHWFNLADAACEEALYDSAALRAFAGIDLGREPVPDATTILKFRHLLERHHLGQAIFAEVGRILQECGLRLSAGIIVDATIIAAPSSIKNAEQQRDPDMKQTRKGNQWHFGMKVHVGADSKTGLVHSVVVTSANVHDKHPLPDLLHGAERRVYGDRGYQGCTDIIKAAAPQACDFTNRRVRKPGGEDEAERLRNRTKSRNRARVEHPLHVLKRLWGFAKVRYRGLAKNANCVFTALAMVNLYMAARRVPALVRP
ncbi:IS5 family transposase [Calidifontimicrobium sp. SYSU G02091]|uniref:IS5 family transposase n=1 Tax=Calidifontimicrobium sp. SYSU G02091 TaxID=2926421 RepID=UPI001F535999|nr:IS5 family transposase [Calidifontimicrobium sp. SYSU G02091]MCI1191270.1 IS5 family transposase [Calidifontimicrobium sp. SYSU G02091]